MKNKSNKIILIQNWFNSNKRHSEFMECLLKNDKNPYIDEIVLFCNNQHSDFKKLSNKITYINVKNIPTYLDYFEYVNSRQSNDIFVLSNLDIYFDDSINRVETYLTEGKILALTRWDIAVDGSKKFLNAPLSQDVWVFRTPIDINGLFLDFSLGVPGCDNRLAYELSTKYDVINPSLDIIINHLHLTQNRRYLVPEPYKDVPIFGYNMISFSLFNTIVSQTHRTWDIDNNKKDRYWYNIPAIIAIYKTLYPTFIIRLHVSKNIVEHPFFKFLKGASDYNLITIQAAGDKYSGTEPSLWRYHPIFDKNVSTVFVRDIDSLPTSSELAANKYFIESTGIISTIRSHSGHNAKNTTMLAGLCNFKPMQINHVKTFDEFFKASTRTTSWGCDQNGIINYFCGELRPNAEQFLDFAIQGKGQIVGKPQYDNATAIVNPTLSGSDEMYFEHKKLIEILDTITEWSGQPIDSRGTVLSDILDNSGKVGEDIRKIIADTKMSNFYFNKGE